MREFDANAVREELRMENGKPVVTRFVNSSLTPTEHLVLMDAAQGLSTSESAAAHWKAAETVKSQRKKVMVKFGAKNMTHAVYLAMRKGVIE